MGVFVPDGRGACDDNNYGGDEKSHDRTKVLDKGSNIIRIHTYCQGTSISYSPGSEVSVTCYSQRLLECEEAGSNKAVEEAHNVQVATDRRGLLVKVGHEEADKRCSQGNKRDGDGISSKATNVLRNDGLCGMCDYENTATCDWNAKGWVGVG